MRFSWWHRRPTIRDSVQPQKAKSASHTAFSPCKGLRKTAFANIGGRRLVFEAESRVCEGKLSQILGIFWGKPENRRGTPTRHRRWRHPGEGGRRFKALTSRPQTGRTVSRPRVQVLLRGVTAVHRRRFWGGGGVLRGGFLGRVPSNMPKVYWRRQEAHVVT